jgi:ribulose-phosphate 3-epimerase
LTVRIAPSILAADFAHLADDVARVEAAGADLLHVDVMDGHFVPNITFGIPIVSALSRVTRLPLDVHLMIDDPNRYLEVFAMAGASRLSVHAEVCPHLHRTLGRIRELGCHAGVAINPSTPVTAIAEVVPLLDQVLVMSVNPGFTGQLFIPDSIRKVAQVRELLDGSGSTADVVIDGGVTIDNAAALCRAGASVIVAGAAVFHAGNPADALRALRQAAAGRS